MRAAQRSVSTSNLCIDAFQRTPFSHSCIASKILSARIKSSIFGISLFIIEKGLCADYILPLVAHAKHPKPSHSQVTKGTPTPKYGVRLPVSNNKELVSLCRYSVRPYPIVVDISEGRKTMSIARVVIARSTRRVHTTENGAVARTRRTLPPIVR